MNNWNVSSVSVFASAKGLYLDRYYYSQDRWNEKSAKPNSIPGKSILHLLISVGKILIRSTKHLYSLFSTLASISSRTKLFSRLIGRKPPVLRADVVIVTQKTLRILHQPSLKQDLRQTLILCLLLHSSHSSGPGRVVVIEIHSLHLHCEQNY